MPDAAPPSSSFDDPAVAASYVGRTQVTVPYLPIVHGYVEQILAETVPADGRVLVVGAGGGLELAYLAERHAGWTFDGVDPSEAMLGVARTTMGRRAGRARLHHGYVDQAPAGPFDGATCLLTLHFLPRAQRLRTLAEIRRRLRPAAPLLTLHHSVPPGAGGGAWLARFARTIAPEADAAQTAATARAMAGGLPLLSPDEDEAVLREAGFGGIGLFFTALTIRGWLAYG